MYLGIDASNIRGGGGVTHLVEFLRVANPQSHGFERIIVWGGAKTLSEIEEHPWLDKVHDPLLDRPLPLRVLWQFFRLKKLAREARCDILFVPGGSDASGFRPMATMAQNMLPFEWHEMWRFRFSPIVLKLLLLRFTQSRTFRKADGLIFLTDYARDAVSKITRTHFSRSTIIPHGINRRFFLQPRPQRKAEEFSESHPCKVLYVSTIDVYKHQWHVAEAVAQLKREGLPVRLDLVGPANLLALKRLGKTLLRLDPSEEFICYRGAVQYSELPSYFHGADIFVFASSCENMPNVLLEGMAAGLPIACSNRGPMSEILGDAGFYFDPERPAEIAGAIRGLIEDPVLRANKAKAAFERARVFTWERCARETLGFIAQAVKTQGKNDV